MTNQFKEELKDAIVKVKQKYNINEPLNIVIAKENMAVSLINSNKPYNRNYREGYIKGYNKAVIEG